MFRTFLAACALAILAAWIATPASAQVVVGASGGTTMVLANQEITTVGAILGEIEFQYADDSGRQRGGLISYVGVQTEGGGEQVGGGYRRYFARPGGSFLFIGGGGFVLGTDTPNVTEITAFAGGEIGLQIKYGPDATNKVTGFLGFYPAVYGQDETAIVRAGVRAALN